MKKALRIGYNRYYCDENFNEHIAFVKKNIHNIDEITLFAEFCHHGYWDEDFTRKNTEILTKRIAQYRQAGVKSVGINILNTRGHTLDGWSYLPKAPFQHEVNADGQVHEACLCMNNDAFFAYITKRYAAYAATGADFIWEDDDLRPGGTNLLGCMCDGCIAKFNEEYGYTFDRPTLVESIKADPALKAQWRKYQMDIIIHLEQILYKAMKEVNPAIKVGYMSFFNDPVAIPACGAEMARPGGGFYDERTPLDLFFKGISVQEQILSYPENIRDIQYEYEAFNYQSLDKSAQITETETALALMSGCNGVLYNNDIFYDRQSLLDMLAQNGGKWDALTKRNETLRPTGVFFAGNIGANLFQVGVPVCRNPEDAVCCFVTGTAWNTFDNETIEKILAKGVYTDGEGLQILTEKGYGSRCGGQVKTAYTSGMAERFAEHSLCGKYQNHYRDAFMNFLYYHNNTGCAYELTPAEGAQVVSKLESITHEKLDCSLYVWEGADGSRFAADGYLFPNSIKTYAKKEQLNNVLDWLSGGKLPVKTPENIKLVSGVQADENGNMTVMLTNASLDKTGEFVCQIRSDRTVYIICDNGQLIAPKQERQGNTVQVTLDNLDAWDYVLLTNMK